VQTHSSNPGPSFRSAIALVAAAALLSVATALSALAQGEAPLRYTVKTIENESGVRVILEFSRKPSYEVHGDAKRVYIGLKESDVEAPFKKKDYESKVLERIKFAEGFRTSEVVLFTGSDFSTFATFEMGEPFRIVVDLHRKQAPPMAVSVPGPGTSPGSRGGSGGAGSAGPPSGPGGGIPGAAPGVGAAPGGGSSGPAAGSVPGGQPQGAGAPSPRAKGLGEEDTTVPPRSAFVVVIDPGHGGDDTGARGPSGLLEKDVTLDIARRLKTRVLAEMDAQVIMTRTNDRAVSLDDRTAVANHDRADLFVCIHANSSRRHDARGAETYFLSYQATDADSRAVAAIENNTLGLDEGVQENNNLQMVLWDLAQSAFLKESSTLAEIVQENLNDALGIANRGIKQAPFRVLMGATMPAVLIEVAFISNPEEEKRLRDPAFKDRLAGAIFDSVKRFHAKYLKDRSR
jgi:N-acetylmuramoyl-L-alanine amidase